MSRHNNLLKQLLPPVSYDINGVNLSIELVAEGNSLDVTMLRAQSVLGAITPYRAQELIADWERVLGLEALVNNYQLRLRNVLLKIAETGGLSIPYFIGLAAQLGYGISINEITPFYADIHCVGDMVYIEDAIFIWQVIVRGNSSTLGNLVFRSGESAAGERLLSFGDPVIEQVFEDLKPAHTFVYFAYEDKDATNFD